MNSPLQTNRPEPGKWSAIVFSALMHVALLALLFFGVQWQRRPPEAASVSLVRSLPAIPSQDAVQPPPPPPPEPQPEPKPVQEEPKPKPVEEKPLPVEKPDIALKDQEKKKPKKVEEPKPEQSKPKVDKKPEPEKKPAPEKKPEPKKQPDKKPDAPKPDTPKSDAAPTDRLSKLLAQSDRAAHDAQMQGKLAQEAGRARSAIAGADRSGANDAWKAKVVAKIRGLMVLPPGLKGRPTAEFEVELDPAGGLRAEPRLTKSSGNPALDQIIKRAIKAAEPLPKPPEDALGKPNIFKFDPMDPDF